MGVTSFYKKEKLLISTYSAGEVDSDLVIEHLRELIAFYKKNEILKSVVDVSEVLGSFAKIMAFLESDYYPVAIKNGLKAQAYITTDDLMRKNLSLRLEMMASMFNVQSNVFKTRIEGEKWVKSLP